MKRTAIEKTLMLVSTAVVCLSLTACSSSEQEELQQWMTEQRNLTKPKVEPLPEPARFSPQA